MCFKKSFIYLDQIVGLVIGKMKCVWCNERKSKTRCEGCQQFYCLPCMNKHHDELIIQFELLIRAQNELKESFTVVESTWQTNKELPYLTAINQWEQEIINRVQQIATKARTTANEKMATNISDIRYRIDQLALDMAQHQQDRNFLDSEISGIRNRLEQLNYTIKHINEKIRINYKAPNKVNWGSLIYVTTENNLPELQYEQESSQDKIWNNLRKLIRNKHTNNDYLNKQSSFKRNSSTLTFGSPTCSLLQHDSSPKSESTTSDSSSSNYFSNKDPFDYVIFTSIDPDQLLPQASDA